MVFMVTGTITRLFCQWGINFPRVGGSILGRFYIIFMVFRPAPHSWISIKSYIPRRVCIAVNTFMVISCQAGNDRVISSASIVDEPFYAIQLDIEPAWKFRGAFRIVFFCIGFPVVDLIFGIGGNTFGAHDWRLPKIQLSDVPKPIAPCNIAIMDQNCLIVSIISEAGEEDSSSQKGDLKCLDVDVYPVSMPSPSSQAGGDEGCKDSIEKEEKKEGSTKGQRGGIWYSGRRGITRCRRAAAQQERPCFVMSFKNCNSINKDSYQLKLGF